MSRLLIAGSMIATLALGAGGSGVLARGAAADGLVFSVPSRANTDTSFAVEIRLPARVAAVDGRLFFDTAAAEVIGVAPDRGGVGMTPMDIAGGVAFGAYGLTSSRSGTVLRIVVAPLAAGRLQFRAVIDAAADAAGRRVTVKRSSGIGAVTMGAEARTFAKPRNSGPRRPLRVPTGTRDLVADGRLRVTDVDLVRAAWEQAHLGAPCAALRKSDDANGDGCVDIVDVQAVVAAQGWPTIRGLAVDPRRAAVTSLDSDASAVDGYRAGAVAAAIGSTFTVTSAADTGDAVYGDGKCADSNGRCTLRAALTEANWQRGENRIQFNLPGTAPVPIQLGTPRLTIQDRTGGVVIDGYSQPGSRVNTASVGSNAVPGIELRGTQSSPRSNTFRITSANNTIRGFLFNRSDVTITLDGVDAHHNLLAGNLMGFERNGTPETYRGHDNVYLQNGAHHNQIGAPSLAGRNVMGRSVKAIYLYGPGTDYNVIQNNFLCMTPSGMATAKCSTGIDHDFGPKHNEEGGTGPLERNVIGTTTLNGIEISHGWNRSGADTDDTWHNDHNRIVGNWIGFRGDGSYSAGFRSGQNSPNSNDANGVNVYDGSNFNVVEGNWIASVWDGINTMMPNSTGNIIRNNIIGESPLGQPAPLGRIGINVRTHTKTGVIEGNTIRNAAVYGIGLTQSDVLYFRLSRNIMSDMSGAAIYLAPNPNDPNEGANDLTPAPVITSATTARVTGTGIPGATVEIYRASRRAGQSGLPTQYLASTMVAGNGTWSAPVILQTGQRATALQIAEGNNTSALGRNVSAVFEQAPQEPVAGFSWTQLAGNMTVGFTDTSAGAPAAWSWDFGDGTSSSQQNPNHSYATTGTFTVKLTATNAGGSSSVTKTVTVSPPSQAFLAADAFARSRGSGWGSADIGGAYTIQGATANYSVAGGVGRIVVPSARRTRSAILNGVNQRNVDISFRVAVDKIPAGGRFFVYATARRNSNNEYRPQLVFHANGSVSVHAGVVLGGSETPIGRAVVVPGLTHSPGTYIWVRAQLSGASPTTIRIKAWADGQSEPQAWQYTATNSAAAVQSAGALGLRSYVSSAVANAPVTFSFNDYAVAASQ